MIVDGALQSFDASVTSNIQIGGLTFTTQNLTIQETADSDLTITGTATFSLNVRGGMDTVCVTLGGTVSGESSQPGIVIDQSNGQLVSLDASISGEIMVAGLDIQATSLAIDYQPQQTTYIISGGASFSFDGASVSIMLGGTFSPGIVIMGGQLHEPSRRPSPAISICSACRSRQRASQLPTWRPLAIHRRSSPCLVVLT